MWRDRQKVPGTHSFEMRKLRGRRLERLLISELKVEARRLKSRALVGVTSHEPQYLPLLANGYNTGLERGLAAGRAIPLRPRDAQ